MVTHVEQLKVDVGMLNTAKIYWASTPSIVHVEHLSWHTWLHVDSHEKLTNIQNSKCVIADNSKQNLDYSKLSKMLQNQTPM